jgi:hypothetical protein
MLASNTPYFELPGIMTMVANKEYEKEKLTSPGCPAACIQRGQHTTPLEPH